MHTKMPCRISDQKVEMTFPWDAEDDDVYECLRQDDIDDKIAPMESGASSE